jgi:anti-anti-sigma factor
VTGPADGADPVRPAAAGPRSHSGEEQILENTGWALATEQVGSEIVLRPSGPLDLETAGHLRAAGITALRRATTPTLTVDLSEVTFLDSTGLGVLVTLWHEARSLGGQFRVSRPSESATRILAITGVDTLFDLV